MYVDLKIRRSPHAHRRLELINQFLRLLDCRVLPTHAAVDVNTRFASSAHFKASSIDPLRLYGMMARLSEIEPTHLEA
jgi:hypothetical protein